ncbi:unnamed protein product [Tilletia controversa]|nr:unnamed protein product [Tilletia controversa]
MLFISASYGLRVTKRLRLLPLALISSGNSCFRLKNCLRLIGLRNERRDHLVLPRLGLVLDCLHRSKLATDIGKGIPDLWDNGGQGSVEGARGDGVVIIACRRPCAKVEKAEVLDTSCLDSEGGVEELQDRDVLKKNNAQMLEEAKELKSSGIAVGSGACFDRDLLRFDPGEDLSCGVLRRLEKGAGDPVVATLKGKSGKSTNRRDGHGS